MVSFCRFLAFIGVSMSSFFNSVLFHGRDGVPFHAHFSFSFSLGLADFFSRDFSQAPKDRCGVASGELRDWGTSVIGRGAWSSFLVRQRSCGPLFNGNFWGRAHPGWR